jgi:hypothetical protein
MMPGKVAEAKPKQLYEEDFNLWLETQASLLREGRFNELDLENLTEELTGEVNAERRIAKATLSLLFIGDLLKHKDVPAEWWLPYIESFALHYPNASLPQELVALLDQLSLFKNKNKNAAAKLSDCFETLLEEQLKRNPSLIHHLIDSFDSIEVKAYASSALWTDIAPSALDDEKRLANLFVQPLDPSSLWVEPAYKRDRYKWLKWQLKLLRTRQLGKLDAMHLTGEVSEIAKRDKRALESRLIILLKHLLKYQFQPGERSSSWTGTVREQRERIGQILNDSPSLKQYLLVILKACYTKARQGAHDETGLPLDLFPETCPYALEQVLDETFLPDA